MEDGTSILFGLPGAAVDRVERFTEDGSVVLTGRLCRQAARQVASGRRVSAVAAELGVSWPVAHRHYAMHADGLLTEPEPPVVLGIDETRRDAEVDPGCRVWPVGADGAVRDELH
jgi:hypothetical protein